MTLKEIREDLKEIRHYYFRKEIMDAAFRYVGKNNIVDKVKRYSNAVESAPPRLYDLYVSLYTRNLTQEALSAELGYTAEYIQMLNKQLLLFLQKQLKERN